MHHQYLTKMKNTVSLKLHLGFDIKNYNLTFKNHNLVLCFDIQT
jgi:hypothetical protein